ncbi:DUF2242 domain-containing protein [Variovorax paradoxus]|uniref:DUF2242 domain-containing protein n=1 Tax=Variovorax paradoxus TaxID=34073 RepID=UPI0027839174|nr:DUF2242 domain-containing protein [Variovorax paradoxus]MDQ0587853.1 hypothetical protein [Variovorax paradoxus]
MTLPPFSTPASSVLRTPVLVLGLASMLVLASCGSSSTRRVSYETEEFDSTTTHTRTYSATEAQTCEAARRALLSQGYMISAANTDLVTGRKSFQPASEVHVEVEFRVVCAREGGGKAGKRSTVAFATALQDRYGIKKVNNSASVGVGAFGSLSLPFAGSDDAMVKVASETLTDELFYDRFFALLDRFLEGQGGEEPEVPSVAPEMPRPSAPPAPAAPALTFPVKPVPNPG